MNTSHHQINYNKFKYILFVLSIIIIFISLINPLLSYASNLSDNDSKNNSSKTNESLSKSEIQLKIEQDIEELVAEIDNELSTIEKKLQNTGDLTSQSKDFHIMKQNKMSNSEIQNNLLGFEIPPCICSDCPPIMMCLVAMNDQSVRYSEWRKICLKCYNWNDDQLFPYPSSKTSQPVTDQVDDGDESKDACVGNNNNFTNSNTNDKSKSKEDICDEVNDQRLPTRKEILNSLESWWPNQQVIKMTVRDGNIYVTDLKNNINEPFGGFRSNGNGTNLPKGEIYFIEHGREITRISDLETYPVANPGMSYPDAKDQGLFDVFINQDWDGYSELLKNSDAIVIDVLDSDIEVISMDATEKLTETIIHAAKLSPDFALRFTKSLSTINGISSVAFGIGKDLILGNIGQIMDNLETTYLSAEAVNIAQNAQTQFEIDYAARLLAGQTISQITGRVIGRAIDGVKSRIDATSKDIAVLGNNLPDKPGESPKRVDTNSKKNSVADRIDTWVGDEFPFSASSKEVDSIKKLDDRSWSRIENYAETHSVDQIKGKIAEELYIHTPEFQKAMNEAKIRAIKEGIPPNDVEFVRDFKGIAPRNDKSGNNAALTDGAIVAVHGDPNNPTLRIFAVFESKSPGNKKALYSIDGEATGQLDRDYERFSVLPIDFKRDGAVTEELHFSPENIKIGRCSTKWYGILPPSTRLSDKKIKGIRERLDYQSIQGPVSDKFLKELATVIKKDVDSRKKERSHH